MSKNFSTTTQIISWGAVAAAGQITFVRWLHPATFSSNAILIVLVIAFIAAITYLNTP